MTTLKTLAIAAATVTLSAASASALTVDLHKVGNHALEHNIDVGTVPGEDDYDGAAGGFKMEFRSSPNPALEFAAWCLDIGTYMQNGRSEYTAKVKSDSSIFNNAGSAVLLSETRKGYIQSLFDVAYDGVKGKLNQAEYSGGFQLALWEILYEDPTDDDVAAASLSLDTGTFKDSKSSAAHNYANSILGMLGAEAQKNKYSLVFFESTDDRAPNDEHYSQNLVAGFMGTTPTGINPIPVPAAGLLLLGALGGLGLAKRRRKAG